MRGYDIDHLTNLLTPDYEGEDVTYKEYIEKINSSYIKKVNDRYNLKIHQIIYRDMKLIVKILLNKILPSRLKHYIKKAIKK